MAVKIIVGDDDSGNGIECACFYDTVTDTVFGTKLNDLEEAESFQEWVTDKYKNDLRFFNHAEFENMLGIFREERNGR